MKKVMKNWRYWLMGIIAIAAFVNLVAVPYPCSANYWLLMLYSKFAAVVLAYFDMRLFAWFAKHRKIDDLNSAA